MQIRDRIKELRRIKASDLLDNPKNWRKHPKSQLDALEGLLKEIGFAGAELAIETPDGVMLIDGHARKGIAKDQEIPVLITDLTPAEADILLATYDPIAAMAQADQTALDSLLGGLEAEDAEVQKLLDGLASGEPAEETVELKQLETRPPPIMTWVLIGIPTVRFGEISEHVEAIAAGDDVICETTVSSHE